MDTSFHLWTFSSSKESVLLWIYSQSVCKRPSFSNTMIFSASSKLQIPVHKKLLRTHVKQNKGVV